MYLGKLQIVDFGTAPQYGQADTYVYTNKNKGLDLNRLQYINKQTRNKRLQRISCTPSEFIIWSFTKFFSIKDSNLFFITRGYDFLDDGEKAEGITIPEHPTAQVRLPGVHTYHETHCKC